MFVEDLKGDCGRELGRSAVDKVIDLDLGATPQNYELWLNYLGNWVPGLRAEVDAAISEAGALSEDRSEELYERYFSTSKLNNDIVDTGDRLAQELAEALSSLKDAGARTKQFGEKLNGASNTLQDGNVEPADLISLISELITATREMSLENEKLGAQLENSTREIDDLRTNLQMTREAALTDALTGVANRKLFDETLRFRKKESQSLNYPMSLMICDIDHFKNFNDKWGHQTGDQVIRFVASALQRLALEDHLVARYGGEEFAIVMPRISLRRALPVVERMRRAIEAKQLMRKSTNQSLGSVTISCGIAMLRPDDTIQSLIERADECLYTSKRKGRNRVTTEDDIVKRAA